MNWYPEQGNGGQKSMCYVRKLQISRYLTPKNQINSWFIGGEGKISSEFYGDHNTLPLPISVSYNILIFNVLTFSEAQDSANSVPLIHYCSYWKKRKYPSACYIWLGTYIIIYVYLKTFLLNARQSHFLSSSIGCTHFFSSSPNSFVFWHIENADACNSLSKL